MEAKAKKSSTMKFKIKNISMAIAAKMTPRGLVKNQGGDDDKI